MCRDINKVIYKVAINFCFTMAYYLVKLLFFYINSCCFILAYRNSNKDISFVHQGGWIPQTSKFKILMTFSYYGSKGDN